MHIGSNYFPTLKSGEFLLKRGLSRVFAVTLVIAAMAPLSTGVRTQNTAPSATVQLQDPDPLPLQPSPCFGSVVQKISFPGLDDSDQQTLRNMLPIHEGQPLDREQLQESMRILFATGRFADLRAECKRSVDQIALIFENTPNFFL